MRDVRAYLHDIDQSCGRIFSFTESRTIEDFAEADLLRSAVERQFEIIGEAMSQALKTEPNLANRITNAARIVAFRNRLIHAYAFVAPDVVWGVIQRHLPTLHAEIREIMGTGRD